MEANQPPPYATGGAPYPNPGGDFPGMPSGSAPYPPPGGAQVEMPWMPKPVVQGCPPGLEYLSQINQLLVKQKKEMIEMITNIEMPNEYVCYNTMGQQVYFCREESTFMKREFQGSDREFTMHVQDTTGCEVIRIHRPYKYTCCGQCFSCSECCLDEMTIEAPVGQTIGFVKQLSEGCNIRYAICDGNRNPLLRIHGPSYFKCPCFGEDINFSVVSIDGATEVGQISRKWTNMIQEYYTNVDNFGVSFPMDLDVRVKATLLGAVFLIDFMYFEESHDRSRD